MKRYTCLVVASVGILLLLSIIIFRAKSTSPLMAARVATNKPRVLEAYGKLPMAFEANRGQTDGQVKFLSRGSGYTVFLTPSEAVLALRRTAGRESSAAAVLRMKLMGASAAAKVTGLKELPGKSNYFIGNDPRKWHTQVPAYAQVRYQNAYPGIDLLYYGHQGQLEYDFVVAPGASPKAITLAITGTSHDGPLRIDSEGNLVASLDDGQVSLHKPVVYQPAGAGRNYVDGRYVLKGEHEVGFEIAASDPARPLVIDPTLTYSTYLGGTDYDDGNGIAVDSVGNAYVTGSTFSTDFPTSNALQPSRNGFSVTAFVAAIDPTGTTLLYSTYLGGSGGDSGLGIAVDSAGDAYVTGLTGSTNFPTSNPLQPGKTGLYDAFVAKIDPTGATLLYSTYLGGSNQDGGVGIAVDNASNAYVTGRTRSTDFPTSNPFQPTNRGFTDAFVAAIDPTGVTLLYSTYLGGNNDDGGNGIGVDSAGNAYVIGSTFSTDFPTSNPLQPTKHGSSEAFVASIAP